MAPVSRIFIHATNVHSGGGRSLLTALLATLPADREVIALLDARMVSPSHPGLTLRHIQPSLLQRGLAEWRLAAEVRPGDQVLCFGNLPPLFTLRVKAWVFVQNRYLVDPVSLHRFPIKTRLRLAVERLWLARRARHVAGFIVQTHSMRALLEASALANGKPVKVLPFVNISAGYERTAMQTQPLDTLLDFVYVASGEPHKNHHRLIEAWCLLAESGVRPSLTLTVDEDAHAELCAWIDLQKIQFGLRLENHGSQQHHEILRLYTEARALVYPSLFESFGLPLIEARQAGLAIVASELDYVRDVVDPEQVFDPHSPISIARAVKRFLGQSEHPLPLMNAGEFLAHIFPGSD